MKSGPPCNCFVLVLELTPAAAPAKTRGSMGAYDAVIAAGLLMLLRNCTGTVISTSTPGFAF